MTLWGRLAEVLAGHGAAALVTLRRVRGSAPREAGAWMVVRPDGAFHGTIGGGRLEWEALALARAALSRGRGPAEVREQALGPDLGQCCGGAVTLLVETFDERDAPVIKELAAREARGPFQVEAGIGEDGRVVRTPSPLEGEGGPRVSEGRERGSAPTGAPAQADRHPSAPSSVFASRAPHGAPPLPTSPDGEVTLPLRGGGREPGWTERHGLHLTPLLLFGAGHVGRALALALAPLPFHLRWIDPRPDGFPAHIPANAVPVRVDDPAAEIAAAPPGALVLVMTHDHGLDLAVTAAALGRADLPLVGLIGSATKRARFERQLRALGVPEARIEGLVCPIGVPGVAGKEPAVIAAATVAQMLQVRERLAGPGEA